MIKLEDLKVGDYVENIYSNTVFIVKKINKKSFTTIQGATIYENCFEDCFVITEEEARASIIHKYNQELKELNENLKSLDCLVKIIPYYKDCDGITDKNILKRDFPFLILFYVLNCFFCFNSHLGKIEGILLFSLFLLKFFQLLV